MMMNFRKARNVALSFTSFFLSLTALVSLIAMLAAYSNQPVSSAYAAPPSPIKGKKTMRSFGSDEELKAYLKKLAEEQRRGQRREPKSVNDSAAAPATAANQASGLAKVAE